LRNHNAGTGPKITGSFGLIPFAMFAYVVGFQHEGERLNFESLWKVTARRRRSIVTSSNNGLVVIARELVAEFNKIHHEHLPLRLVQCGSVVACS
jgi:hypothetical protein